MEYLTEQGSWFQKHHIISPGVKHSLIFFFGYTFIREPFTQAKLYRRRGEGRLPFNVYRRDGGVTYEVSDVCSLQYDAVESNEK